MSAAPRTKRRLEKSRWPCEEPRKTAFPRSSQDLFPFVVRYRTMNGAGNLQTALRYLRANGFHSWHRDEGEPVIRGLLWERFQRVGRTLSATQASCTHEFPMADNARPARLQEGPPGQSGLSRDGLRMS